MRIGIELRAALGPGTLCAILGKFREELIGDQRRMGVYRITKAGRAMFWRELENMRHCVDKEMRSYFFDQRNFVLRPVEQDLQKTASGQMPGTVDLCFAETAGAGLRMRPCTGSLQRPRTAAAPEDGGGRRSGMTFQKAYAAPQSCATGRIFPLM